MPYTPIAWHGNVGSRPEPRCTSALRNLATRLFSSLCCPCSNSNFTTIVFVMTLHFYSVNTLYVAIASIYYVAAAGDAEGKWHAAGQLRRVRWCDENS